MWVQLLSYWRLPDKTAKLRLHYPGEIVEVKNKAIAQEMIVNKHALSLSLTQALPEGEILSGTGIVLRGQGVPGWVEATELEIVRGQYELAYPITIMLDAAAQVRVHDLRCALTQFGRRYWDVAAPVVSYGKTAAQMGTDEDRQRTAATVPTLYSIVYDTRLILAKKNETTRALFDAFADERKGNADINLAFLRAVYQTRPYLWALQKELLV